MNIKLQKKLFKKYPKIFSDRYRSPKETAMCFGIETGDGWYSLIDCLCKQIQSECDKSTSEYQVFAIQVKEKFGGLRFYTYNSTEEIEKYITFAENLSYYICSICGKMDETVTQTKGWIITLCEECKNSKANNR